MSTAKVGFVQLSEEKYNALKAGTLEGRTFDENTFYFLTDREKLYLGSKLIGTKVDDVLSPTSENPVQNKVIAAKLIKAVFGEELINNGTNSLLVGKNNKIESSSTELIVGGSNITAKNSQGSILTGQDGIYDSADNSIISSRNSTVNATDQAIIVGDLVKVNRVYRSIIASYNMEIGTSATDIKNSVLCIDGGKAGKKLEKSYASLVLSGGGCESPFINYSMIIGSPKNRIDCCMAIGALETKPSADGLSRYPVYCFDLGLNNIFRHYEKNPNGKNQVLYDFVFGNNNRVCGQYNAVFGTNHNFTQGQTESTIDVAAINENYDYNLVAGYGNEIYSGKSAVIGYGLKQKIAKKADGTNQYLFQCIFGTYNAENENAAFIVGGGPGAKARKNLFTILHSGKALVNASTSASDSDLTLTTKDYVDKQINDIAVKQIKNWTKPFVYGRNYNSANQLVETGISVHDKTHFFGKNTGETAPRLDASGIAKYNDGRLYVDYPTGYQTHEDSLQDYNTKGETVFEAANKGYVDKNKGTKLYKHTRTVSFVPVDIENWGDYFECVLSCVTDNINNVIIIGGAEEGEGIPVENAIDILGAYISDDRGDIILQPILTESFGGGAISLLRNDEWNWMPETGYNATLYIQSWLRAAMRESGGLTYYTIGDESVVEL